MQIKTLRGQKIQNLDSKLRTNLAFCARAGSDTENDVRSKQRRARSAQDQQTQLKGKIKVPNRSARTEAGSWVCALHTGDECECEMTGGQRADVLHIWWQVQDPRFGRWSIKDGDH